MLLGKSKTKVSSRQQIQIKEVREGVLVLPQDKYRAVLETSAINFELKSEDEQDALIDNFQNFLNALPCPLQIIVKIREIDLDHYLEGFARKKDKEAEKVYRQQIENYCHFIQDMVSGNKILSRRFYIVVPYEERGKKQDFETVKEQLTLHTDIVTKGLEKMGMKTRILDSLEILELFYNFYNFSSVKSQPLTRKTFKEILYQNYAV